MPTKAEIEKINSDPVLFQAYHGRVNDISYKLTAKGLRQSREFKKFFGPDVDLQTLRMCLYCPKTKHPDRVFFDGSSGRIVGWENSGGPADSYWIADGAIPKLWLPQDLARDAVASVRGLKDVEVKKPTYI